MLSKGRYFLFVARSISEEFSSGDAKYRDNDEPVQGPHGRDPRYNKDKEDKERGDEGILFKRMILHLYNSCTYTYARACVRDARARVCTCWYIAFLKINKFNINS